MLDTITDGISKYLFITSTFYFHNKVSKSIIDIANIQNWLIKAKIYQKNSIQKP